MTVDLPMRTVQVSVLLVGSVSPPMALAECGFSAASTVAVLVIDVPHGGGWVPQHVWTLPQPPLEEPPQPPVVLAPGTVYWAV